MRTNPMIKKGLNGHLEYTGETMSIAGARNKALGLLSITCVVAFIAYYVLYAGGNPNFNLAYTLSAVGGFVGLGLVIAMSFKPHISNVVAPIYAICEGVFVGAITVSFAYYFDGVVPKAVVLTLLAIIFTLLLYREAPELAGKIRNAVMILALTIIAASLLGFVFSLLGFGNVLIGNSLFSIGFSIFTVIVAIAFLLVDYDNIIIGARHNLPKYMESYFAVGLLVTIIWVYVEMLELLAKLASRD
ncbi:hypothetical protein AN641_05780 [Candidatus Epulonipiscioides gigas]|nr:hypothetical protein AN641_05780 [Epulopiscium sp. SCG-C07WGA-EpuloA2]